MHACDFLSQEKDFEEGPAPSFSFVSLRNKPNHRAYCTDVEPAQLQRLFCPPPCSEVGRCPYTFSCTLCSPQVFKISLAEEDLSRQQYIDVPMIVNGIAERLGIASEAARNTRGFGTIGNPRNGSLSVVTPPHLWERLEKVLTDI
eukprot:40795-Pleurochrysis_carterae.AAC.1